MQTFHVHTDNKLELRLKKLKHKQKNFVFAAEEHEVPLLKSTIKFLKNFDIQWIFGGADPNFYKNYPGKVTLWHNFYMYDSYLNLDKRFYDKTGNIEKIFISMNNNAHPHRCILMDTLAKHQMIDHGYISWRGANKGICEFKYWREKKLDLDDGFLTIHSMHTLPPKYSNSLINLISESTLSTLFVTEKTYNAIFAEKPFLIQGPVRIHEYLSNLGFEMYDEIFDYSFDNLLDDVLRTEMLIENLKSLKKKDLNALKKILSKKAERNKQIALGIIKNRKHVPHEAYYFPSYTDIINRAVDKASESIP